MKKFFSLLSITLLVFSLIACKKVDDDGIVKGSLSGKLVYDGNKESGAKWISNTTKITLTNATFNAISTSEEISFQGSVFGKDGKDLYEVFLEPTADISAGATSGDFKVTGNPEDSEDYDDTVYILCDFEKDKTSYVKPDEGKFFLTSVQLSGNLQIIKKTSGN